jgi:hypothetical protein
MDEHCASPVPKAFTATTRSLFTFSKGGAKECPLRRQLRDSQTAYQCAIQGLLVGYFVGVQSTVL